MAGVTQPFPALFIDSPLFDRSHLHPLPSPTRILSPFSLLSFQTEGKIPSHVSSRLRPPSQSLNALHQLPSRRIRPPRRQTYQKRPLLRAIPSPRDRKSSV